MRSIAKELNFPEITGALNGPERTEYLALTTTWDRFVVFFLDDVVVD
jgi:hypothetical protein